MCHFVLLLMQNHLDSIIGLFVIPKVRSVKRKLYGVKFCSISQYFIYPFVVYLQFWMQYLISVNFRIIPIILCNSVELLHYYNSLIFNGMIEQIDHISDIYVLTWWVFAKYGWSHMIAAGIKTICLYAKHMNVAINYHRRGKIRWAK